MTVIATDGQSMAGDGLCTGNGLKHSFAVAKVRKLSGGRIVGMCGDTYAFDSFVTWIEDGAQLGHPIDLGDEFEALVLHPDGSVRSYDGKGRTIPQEAPAVAGSGGAIALGAMLHGATPGEAVNIASKRDVHSGGRIKVEYLTPRLEEAA